MKKVVFSLLMTLFCIAAGAQESQTQYNFLRLPASAHAAALGGDNITIIEDDPTLTFNNPALLGSVSDKTINLNFMTYMEGAITGSASFSRVVNEKASWAALAQYIDYGTMKETDANNIQNGDFSARDIALSGVFSYTLAKNLVGGITAKFITSYIGQYNSLAAAVDLGINYYDEEHEWSLSAVARNLGGQLTAYEDDFERLPLDLQVGISKRLIGSPLRLSAALVRLNDWEHGFGHHLVVGADLLLSSQFYVAAGYNALRAQEMKIDSGDSSSSHGAALSFGAGLTLQRLKARVSYGKYHVSSTALLLNFSYQL